MSASLVLMRRALEALEHAYIVATEHVEEDGVAEPLMEELKSTIGALESHIEELEIEILAE